MRASKWAAQAAAVAMVGTAMLVWNPAEVDAQRRPSPRAVGLGDSVPTLTAGLRGGYDFDVEAWSAGAQIGVALRPRLVLAPSGDLFFRDGRTDWQVNGDLVLRPRPHGLIYGGGGVAAVHRASDGAEDEADTRVGANAFVGLSTPGLRRRARVRPFVEARWTFVDGESPFRLAFGLNVPLTHGR